MLVFDTKRLCLQGTNGDGERKDEVEKAKRRKGVMCEFEAKLDLDGCQFTHCKKACSSRTGSILNDKYVPSLAQLISRQSCLP